MFWIFVSVVVFCCGLSYGVWQIHLVRDRKAASQRAAAARRDAEQLAARLAEFDIDWDATEAKFADYVRAPFVIVPNQFKTRH